MGPASWPVDGTVVPGTGEILLAESSLHFGGAVEFAESHTGLHLLGYLPKHVCDLALAAAARSEAAAFDERQIRAGLERLAPLIERAVDLRESMAAS